MTIDLDYQLTDGLTKEVGRVFASGTQALVRALIMQRLADRRDGIRSAGFVSGYRGSPLAGVDTELWRAKASLGAHDIEFLPGVNEDLAATAVAGTQRVGSDPRRKVDGVFGLWYGKGPGLDRAGDAIRHGHGAGASAKGGVVMAVGDDHAATSSSIPNASDMSLAGWSIPIVHPAGIDDYVELALWGWAASRFSGSWVALKAISETVESSRSFNAAALPRFTVPTDHSFPPGGLGYDTREFLTPGIEVRMMRRMEAFQAFAARNPLDRTLVDADGAELGFVAVGKAALDLLEMFERAGLPAAALAEQGVRVWRPGLTFPLDGDGFHRFAAGLKHILVVEEKVSLVEGQVRELLYNLPAGQRPSLAGRRDLDGAPLVSVLGQLRPSLLAGPVRSWLERVRPTLAVRIDPAAYDRPATLANAADGMRRLPYFCSGCPHNTSTKVPEGSVALAGVGCHYMASWMDRDTSGLTQMGAEGADWVGQARFTELPHVFQNMGEGTYFHSGHLAIRQAIAAGVNATYKILFNDAVAMTGGQPVDGQLTVPKIVGQMLHEGARKVAVVTDDPDRYRGVKLDAGIVVRHRRELDAVQRELRDIPGVTILVYDQTCAAEKRRRRKRGKFPDPDRRIFINSAVCEGCGDCGKASNCLSVVPLETDLGRKRAIDQSSCNKDFSCVDGFCPSFVSVSGGKLRRNAADARDWVALAGRLSAPTQARTGPRPHNLLIAGVGGSGIITVGAIVAMAAHLDGREVAELDFTALAQKGGSVMCHLRTAPRGTAVNQPRIDWGEADAVIMGDLIVGCLPDSIGTIRRGSTAVLANTEVGSLAEFTRNPDADPHVGDLLAKVRHAAGEASLNTLDAARVARERFGDTNSVNMLLLGHAWQQGMVPVSEAALLRAITLNGVAVEVNQRAFACGRVLAVEAPVPVPASVTPLRQESLDALLDRRCIELAAYQNGRYAASFHRFVDRCAAAERRMPGGGGELRFTRAVAASLFKLMAYKDEYEVARLYTRPDFMEGLRRQFDGDLTLRFHLAPPLLSRPRKGEAAPRKVTLGPWMLRAFAVLARLRLLRHTPLDPFGYTAERKTERRLVGEYRATMEVLLGKLSPATLGAAVELAGLPMSVRGFGHVKMAALAKARDEERRLLDRLGTLEPTPPHDARTAA